MLDRLAAFEAEYSALEDQLADPVVLADQTRLRSASQRFHDLEPIVAAARRYQARTEDLGAAKEMLTGASDADERELMREEVTSAEADLEALEEELRLLLLPKDPNDGRNVIVEIRGAEGGEEANLFARDLFEMYVGYASRKGWPLEVLSEDASDLGGYNQVTFEVRGADAWSHFKFEGGPHRVQRVPVTESQGRIHTSSATVLVLPEPDDVEVVIDPTDLDVDTYRSSGAGGQHVNKTDSAVRITHRPTGVVVAMQDERSQLQNRARAMQVLRARLAQLQHDELASAQAVERRAQVGGGGRSEKIRTYNYKENRITDHRIGLTLYKLDAALNGDLDDVVGALQAEERTRQLSGDDDA